MKLTPQMRRLIHKVKAEPWMETAGSVPVQLASHEHCVDRATRRAYTALSGCFVSTRNVKLPLPPLFVRLWRETGLDLPLTAEHRFHATRRWRFDFACIPARVAIEIEGGTWAGKPCPVCGQRGGGRHNRGVGFANDCEKYREAAYACWLVFRFPSEQVTAENVRRLAEFCRDRINPATGKGWIDQ